MPTTAERLASLETLVGEIHGAVVGDGSKGSTMRERVATLEAANGWRNRAIYSVFPSLLVALANAGLGHVGIHIPTSGSPS